MKLCVIGNSHCGALHDGWKQIRDTRPGDEVTFFADRARYASRIRIETVGKIFKTHRLVPRDERTASAFRTTSGGQDAINVKDYDYFLVYGLNSQPTVDQDDRQFSAAVREATWEDRVTGTAAFGVAKKLRALTKVPVLAMANPYRTPLDGVEVPPIDDLVAEEVAFYRRRWAETLGVTFLPQPAETVLAGHATVPAFGKGSRHLQVAEGETVGAHGETEDQHMNADYGKIVMQYVLDNLAEARTAPRQSLSEAAL